MDFQGSKTYQNLLAAYNDELNYCAMYLIFSDVAKNERYMEISRIFDITSINEKEHARVLLRRINQGVLPDTAQALIDSIRYEDALAEKYQEYVQIANEEGYGDIAAVFSGIANISMFHGSRFRHIYSDIEEDQEFCKTAPSLWICMQCGNILSGECAPKICPVCGFPQGYYKLFDTTTLT